MTTAQTPIKPEARPHATHAPTPPRPPSSDAPAPGGPGPDQVNRSQLLAHLYDPDNHTLRLCDLHHLSVHQLADELFSSQIIRAIETAQRIVDLRLTLTRAEAELAV